jgi:hypothetical protein
MFLHIVVKTSNSIILLRFSEQQSEPCILIPTSEPASLSNIIGIDVTEIAVIEIFRDILMSAR